MQTVVPVANGLSTDHPIPDLPFVDDSHIPTTDARAIEAIGRLPGQPTWARFDWPRAAEWDNSPWWAFTTDPRRTDLAWCVRFHPGLGRSVVLVDNAAAGQLHEQWSNEPLLFRAGGYWWDGSHWFRPAQLWDGVAERFVNRAVPMATTVTAADLLTDRPIDPAAVLDIADVEATAAPVRRWDHHLAAWAAARPADALPFAQCVVNLSAPELAGDQLIGAPEIAEMIGAEPSALRTQIARGQVELPSPQAAIAGRNVWSRPVADEWVEAMQRSTDATAAALSNSATEMPVGIHELWEKFAASFFARLWRPERRKRWVLRARNETAVHEVADELATVVALKLDDIIPAQALAGTVRSAILHQFLSDRDVAVASGSERRDVALNWKVATMLDWLIRHHPILARHTVATTIGDAERRGVPRSSSIAALRVALSMDGKLSADDYATFFAGALPPADAA
ncbi:hypothetical protein [Nocardia salmonicida]|uniref:hypothetical protein n=1 Tax=Nocardia salmonicida TaxID=53431 RepID=UPI0007A3E03A|nr:hypothetical protein [Nocardia salmonicida]